MLAPALTRKAVRCVILPIKKGRMPCAPGPWWRMGADLQELELPTPEPTGKQVLLEVTHCGVCHSDLHIWEGFYDIGAGQAHVAEGSRGHPPAGHGT